MDGRGGQQSGGFYPLESVALEPRPAELFAQCWDRIEQFAGEMGRDPQGIGRCLYISVNLNDDVRAALDEGDRYMQAYHSIPYGVISKNLLCVFGPPRKCADDIRAYREAGTDYFIVRFASPDQLRQMMRFTEEVLPFAT